MVTRNRLGPQGIGGPTVITYTAPSSSTPDPRIPGAPTALAGYGSVYLLEGGGYQSAAVLSWTPSPGDQDGNAMNLMTTEIWGKKVVTGSTFAQVGMVSAADDSVTIDGFKPKDTWQFKLRTLSEAGKASGWSNTISIKMPYQDVPPPVPSVPVPTSRLGTVSLRWDGKASGGGAMPPDFDHIRVDRCADDLWITGVTTIDTLNVASIAVDAPLTVGATWFYRFIAFDNAGNPSGPSGSAQIKVDGVTGPDIPDNLIDEAKLAKSITDDIDKALIDSAAAVGATENSSKVFLQPVMPTTGMTSGDMWYDSSHGNAPYRYGIPAGGTVPAWVSVRDDVLNKAFPNGVSLDKGFLEASVVQAKMISAGAVDAEYLIASKSITSASGVIGSLNAGDIKTGFLDSALIKAGSITAGKMVLGDTENLVSEPGFADPGPWVGQGAQADASDLPASGAGKVWRFLGTGLQQNAINTQVSPALPKQNAGKPEEIPADSFYAECWVRKTATSTTGTAALVMNVSRKGTTDTSVVFDSKVYKTTDPANVWVKLSGTALVPDLGYDVALCVRAGADVNVNGQIQFSQVMMRRKLHGSLVVDGSITADQIKSNTITGDQIFGHSITAAEIDAKTIRADSFIAGSITSNSAVIGSLNASKITAGFMDAERITAGSITSDRLDAGHIEGSVIKGNSMHANRIQATTFTGDRINGRQIKAGHIIAGEITGNEIHGRTIKAGHIIAGEITGNEIHGRTIKAGHIIAGQITGYEIHGRTIKAGHIIAGQITGYEISATAINGKTITGATIRTAASGRRVQLSKGGLSFVTSSGTPLLSLATSNNAFYIRSGTSAAHFILDNSGFRLYNSSGKNTVNLSNSGGATFIGNVNASTFNGMMINSATNYGTISGGTISGVVHSGGYLSGTVTNRGTLSGGVMRSSSSTTRVEFNYDRIQLIHGGSMSGVLSPRADGRGIDLYAAGSSDRVFFGTKDSLQVANSGTIYATGIYSNAASGGAAVYIQSNGFLTRHTSSQRYKTAIRDLGLAPEFMDIRTATWLDKPNPATIYHRLSTKGSKRFTGFLAENLHRIGLTDAVTYDRMARPVTIQMPALLAHTVAYVQYLVHRVDELSKRVETLEGVL